MTRLVGTVVNTDEEVEALRTIRNAGAVLMTNVTTQITPAQQRRWWQQVSKLPARDFLPIVYRAEQTIVGYGMLSRRDDVLCVSMAVHPRFRRKGYGGDIYRDLAARVDEPVQAEILRTNSGAIRAARRAGYTYVFPRHNNGRTFILRSPCEDRNSQCYTPVVE